MNKIKENKNAGFSLVEMIVSILIVAIMMFGVTAFISTSRVAYMKVTTSSKLQEEADAAVKFVNELLMEAQDYAWNTGSRSETISGIDYDVLCIKTLDNDPGASATRTQKLVMYYYFILVDKADGTIRYCKKEASAIDGVSDASKRLQFKTTDDGTVRYMVNLDQNSSIFTGVLDSAENRKYAYIAGKLDTSATGGPMAVSHAIQKNGKKVQITFTFKYNGETFKTTINNLIRNKL